MASDKVDLLNKREIVVVNGIKSYLFSHLAQYLTANDELLLNSPQKANGFAAFVMGRFDVINNKRDLEVLLAGEDKPIAAQMIADYVLGKELTAPFQKAVTKLSELGFTHELVSVIDDEKKLAGLIRKNKLEMTKESRILLTVIKIRTAEDNMQRMQIIDELCEEGLEFDCLVLLKLLKLEDDFKKETTAIRKKALVVIEKTPKVWKLMIHCEIENLTERLAHSMSSQFNKSSATEIVQTIVVRLKEGASGSANKTSFLSLKAKVKLNQTYNLFKRLAKNDNIGYEIYEFVKST